MGIVYVAGGARVGERVTFQLWLSPDVDVVVSVEAVSPDLRAYRFSFDGLQELEVQAVARVIAELVVDPSVDALGMVIDRTGASVDIDWDAVIIDRLRARVPTPADLFLGP